MKKGFENVVLPGQKCRKVAGIKQQGHRTANLKRYRTPDKNLTVRFFCNISSAFFASQRINKISSSDLQQILITSRSITADSINQSSFNLELQKAARISFTGSSYLLGKSNTGISENSIQNDLPSREEVGDKCAIKSKKQIKWLSI